MGFMKNKISELLANKNSSLEIIDVYDAIMHEYGFITPEQFLALPQSLVNSLIERINRRRNKNKKLL